MSDQVVVALPVDREFATAIAMRAASRETVARLRALDATSEHVAVAAVSLLLCGGLLLAWEVLCRFAPRDDSLGWAGIVLRTNAIGTGAVSAVAAIHALADLCRAIRLSAR